MNNDKDYITVSEKHGLNPSLVKCFICGEDTGEIALLGKLPNDEEAPRYITNANCFCDRCRKLLEEGNNAILEVKLVRNEKPENCRTGRMVFLRKGNKVSDAPVAYMEQELFENTFKNLID